jgi:hypothetical protein
VLPVMLRKSGAGIIDNPVADRMGGGHYAGKLVV